VNCFPSSDTDFLVTELVNVKQDEPIRKSGYRTKKFSEQYVYTDVYLEIMGTALAVKQKFEYFRYQ
jgi:hypothetical protein